MPRLKDSLFPQSRRHKDIAFHTEADEPAIKQMIYMRSQQQAVVAIQLLCVCAVSPRLDVAGTKVGLLFNTSNSGAPLADFHPRSEQSLTAASLHQLQLLSFTYIPAIEEFAFPLLGFVCDYIIANHADDLFDLIAKKFNQYSRHFSRQLRQVDTLVASTI
jgi:hypothetical protein